MTFGRWILIHSLSISILIMLGLGYFYKQELKLEEAYRQLLLIDATSMTASKDKLSDDVETVTNKLIQSLSPQPTLDVAIKKQPTNLKPSSKAVIIAKDKRVEMPSNQFLKPIEQQKLDNRESALQGDYLLEARKAYWAKNYEYSIQLYKAQINKTPDSADLYGELGNIYYGLDNDDVASSYYLDAGKLFLKMDDQFRAKQIYDILISIAPNKAQLLLNLKNQSHQ